MAAAVLEQQLITEAKKQSIDIETKTIFVAGATGQQGGAVIKALLKRGEKYKILALTRDVESEKAKKLKEKGITLIQGDLDDKKLLEETLKGNAVYGVFCVTTPFGAGIQAEITHGKNLADAAKAAGIKHFVFSSVGQANADTGVPNFESKYEIEKYIKSLGLNFTIIRPVAFFDNFNNNMAPKNGAISLPWSIDLKVQFVATADIGEVAARAFDEPNEFLSQEIELAGDELDGHKIIELLSKILNQPIRYKQTPKVVLKLFAKDFYAMVLFFETKGYHADITALKKKFPELRTFDDWLKENGWDKKEFPQSNKCTIL